MEGELNWTKWWSKVCSFTVAINVCPQWKNTFLLPYTIYQVIFEWLNFQKIGSSNWFRKSKFENQQLLQCICTPQWIGMTKSIKCPNKWLTIAREMKLPKKWFILFKIVITGLCNNGKRTVNILNNVLQLLYVYSYPEIYYYHIKYKWAFKCWLFY